MPELFDSERRMFTITSRVVAIVWKLSDGRVASTVTAGGLGEEMEARRLIGGAAYPPDVLKVIFQAFDDAWAEVCPSISVRPASIEAAKSSLAEIVLSLAKTGPIERDALKNSAVNAFRLKHRLS